MSFALVKCREEGLVQSKYCVSDVSTTSCSSSSSSSLFYSRVFFLKNPEVKWLLGRTTQSSIVLLKLPGWIQDRPTSLLHGSFTSGILIVEKVNDWEFKYLVSKIHAICIIMDISHNIAKLQHPHL